MEPKITSIQYTEGYVYRITFSDNKKGVVNLEPFLWGEAFEQIKDADYFRKAYVDKETGTITWPNGIDLAPEALHRIVA